MKVGECIMSVSTNNLLSLTDYYIKKMMFVEDNIIILVRPREQYFFETHEYNENKGEIVNLIKTLSDNDIMEDTIAVPKSVIEKTKNKDGILRTYTLDK